MRILIVTHEFPPLDTTASRRPYSWARAWSGAGHDVHVLTTRKYPTDGIATRPLEYRGFHVHEVSYLPITPLRPQAVSGGQVPVRRPAWIEVVRKPTRSVRQGLGLFAQSTMLAVRAITRDGAALHASAPFDFLISSYGPEMSAFAGYHIAQRTGAPWIADYRDLWLEEFQVGRYKWTIRATDRLHRRMLKSAKLVSTVSEGLAAQFRRLARCPVWVAYNGYIDHPPDLRAEPAPAGQPRRLVYTGTLFQGKRDPTPVLVALARSERLRQRLRLDLYGPVEPWIERKVAELGLTGVVQQHGSVPYPKSLEEQRGAAALLFIDWMDERAEGVVTSKLFEYLASGRPILCVGVRPDTEAAGIIRGCAAGHIALDNESIGAALSAIADGTFDAQPDADRITRFSRDSQAQALLERIQRVLMQAQSDQPA